MAVVTNIAEEMVEYRTIYITETGDILRISTKKPIPGSYHGSCKFVLIEKTKQERISLSLKRLDEKLTPLCKLYDNTLREYNLKFSEEFLSRITSICKNFIENSDTLDIDSSIAKEFAYITYVYSYSPAFLK